MEIQNLIKSVYNEWRIANAEAQRECERAGLHHMAKKLAVCELLNGDETLPELIDKLFSPQGREFATRFGFPSVETFRSFKQFGIDELGVFVDSAEIALTDVSRVCLIGNTSARLNYRETQGNTVVAMHGARVNINASGFSVVKVERDRISNVNVHISERAIVN